MEAEYLRATCLLSIWQRLCPKRNYPFNDQHLYGFVSVPSPHAAIYTYVRRKFERQKDVIIINGAFAFLFSFGISSFSR